MEKINKNKVTEPFEIDLSGINLVEASAGTGKTFTLILFYLRLLIEKKMSVDKILVLTYTRSATYELRDRIYSSLKKIYYYLDNPSLSYKEYPMVESLLDHFKTHSIEKPHIKLLVENAIHSFDLASIFTIHGFCQRILDTYSFMSGESYEKEFIENDTPILTEIVQDFWAKELYDSNKIFVNYILDNKLTPDNLLKLAQINVNNMFDRILYDDSLIDTSNIEKKWQDTHHKVYKIWKKDKEIILDLLCDPSLHKSIYKKDSIYKIWAKRMDIELQNPSINIEKRFKEFIYFTNSKIIEKTSKKLSSPHHLFFSLCEKLLEVDRKLEKEFQKKIVYFKYYFINYLNQNIKKSKLKKNVYSFSDVLNRLFRALKNDNNTLGKVIAKKYPCALIDEFQDTDPIQYEIFRSIYNKKSHTLFFIGDPKQAIYSFRGADVFSYLNAKKDLGGSCLYLIKNWRSDPLLIEGINHFFTRLKNPFFEEGISFYPLKADIYKKNILYLEKQLVKPIKFLLLPDTENNSKYNKESATTLSSEKVAKDIVHILNVPLYINDKPISPKDIAILCRTNKEAIILEKTLSLYGVPSIREGEKNIFDSSEARDIRLIMYALLSYGDIKKIRAALSTKTLGQKYFIVKEKNNEELWIDWTFCFRESFNIWENKGFTTAFYYLISKISFADILKEKEGEKTITNIRHLCELLQKKSQAENLGTLSLLKWLNDVIENKELRDNSLDESTQIRLESDKARVRIITIHKSKGLEYPIVYCPFLWSTSPNTKSIPWVQFHDPDKDKKLTLDLGSKNFAQHLEIAQKEKISENMRLLYVALTRAKHQCIIVLGNINRIEQSSLIHLLCFEPKFEENELHSRVKTIKDISYYHICETLKELQKTNPNIYELCYANKDDIYDPPQFYTSTKNWKTLDSKRVFNENFIHTSFSSLIKNEHDVLHTILPDSKKTQKIDAPKIILGDLEAGRKTGLFIHDIFENLDFYNVEQKRIKEIVDEKLLEYSFDLSYSKNLYIAIDTILNTFFQKTDSTYPFCLARLNKENRLNEFEFMFSITKNISKKKPIQNYDISDIFLKYSDNPLIISYSQKIKNLSLDISGYLRGFIDLIFRYNDRFYIVDYKSNFLGHYINDYNLSSIEQVMIKDHYILQYHIYILALHKFLRYRLKNYDYEKVFGGVYYLFIRGMSTKYPLGNGIFYDRPPYAIIEKLDTYIKGTHV